MKRLRFDAEILQEDEAGAGAYVLVPPDVMEGLGGKRVPVVCAFDGEPYRGSVVNMGSGPCVGVLKVIREKIGKQRGDVIRVEIRRDEEPRVAEPPPELAGVLERSPKAKAFWGTLSYSRQRQFCLWVGEGKRGETRNARAEKAAGMLEVGETLR